MTTRQARSKVDSVTLMIVRNVSIVCVWMMVFYKAYTFNM